MNPRRKWLQFISLLPMLPISASAANLEKTAKATEGPFYPEPSMRTTDIDNDLVKIEQSVNEAGGEIVYLTGAVTDTANENTNMFYNNTNMFQNSACCFALIPR